MAKGIEVDAVASVALLHDVAKRDLVNFGRCRLPGPGQANNAQSRLQGVEQRVRQGAAAVHSCYLCRDCKMATSDSWMSALPT